MRISMSSSTVPACWAKTSRSSRSWIRGSAWDFGREGPLGEDLSPHLRFSGRWFFHPNFYVLGGVDDPLEQDSLFLGAGARWTDENLKWLLRAMPGG